MSMDALIPLMAMIGWLVLVGSAVASYRLGWQRMLRLALIWAVIILGLFLVVNWLGIGLDDRMPAPQGPPVVASYFT